MATIRKTRERIENAEGYEDVLITLSTWNTLLPAEQPSVMSIRDADGRFFTPGFFTGVHGHRSITQVIGAAKLHSARTRRPGFSVSEADVTITLPAGSTLTQLMDSDDPLQQQVVNIKRLQVGAQAELLSLVGREADRKVSLSETIRSDPGAFFTAFFAYPGYRNVKIVLLGTSGPSPRHRYAELFPRISGYGPSRMHKRPPPALPHQGSFRGAHHGRTDSEAYPYHCSLRLVRTPVFIRNVTSGKNTHSPGIVLSTVFRKTEYSRRLCYKESCYGHTSEAGEAPGAHLCRFQKKRRFPLFFENKKRCFEPT